WQNPEQLFVAQELINKVKSKCCGIKVHFLHFLFWGDSPLLVLLQCWRHSSFCLGLKLYIRSPKSFRADD
ncbi:hypothetical protein, partial [Phocaeicola vulgatus]|uniref:hypothetical protein n=1 Tax=Phocaeicola vulgatus TaxID=821 RepID=UPI001E3D4FF1